MKVTSAKFMKGITGTDEIVTDGLPQIAFVGRSNVGKSSVINSLANSEDLVKTGKKPGKTVELNFFLINRQFYFVDLPGYGYARLTPAEREKIRKWMLWYLLDSGAKPLVVLVLDIKAGFTDFDAEMVQVLKEAGHDYVIVANKADKLNQKETSQQLNQIEANSNGKEVIPYSAMTRDGAEELLEKLLEKVEAVSSKQ